MSTVVGKLGKGVDFEWLNDGSPLSWHSQRYFWGAQKQKATPKDFTAQTMMGFQMQASRVGKWLVEGREVFLDPFKSHQ